MKVVSALFLAGNPQPLGLTVKTAVCVAGTTGVAFTSYLSPVSTGSTCPLGCSTCTADFANCTACLQHNYRVATPDTVTKQCPCLPGFYMHPTAKICLGCPLNQYCKTCEYNSLAGGPLCTSCYCNQHRTLNTAGACVCDSTHQQDGTNAYCTPGTAP